MSYIDPLKVVRNPETLAAYRRYQRELRASAQPWPWIAVAAVLTETGGFLIGLLRNIWPSPILISGLVFVFGVSFAMAAFRMWRFRRTHPFESP